MMVTRVVSVLVIGLALVAPATVAAGKEDAAAADAHAAPDASDHSEDGHGDGGGLNPVSLEAFQADLAVWTAAVFLVLLLILWKFAWGPITRGLDTREQGVADQIAQAEESNRQAKELLAQYEQKLADSKEEVREILARARSEAEQAGHQMLDKAREESRAEQQRAMRQIDLATTDALKQLADKSATLAVELAGKIVGEKLDPKSHARLIERAVTSFAGQKPGNN